ncbi:MAG: iron-containing alcohol dehydrogenase [Verrucomicrobiia bacterium]
MVWEFATAGRLLFGEGAVSALRNILPTFGPRFAIVTGASQRFLSLIRTEVAYCPDASLHVVTMAAEPSVQQVEQAAFEAVGFQATCLIGIGGGSSMDAAKAIAVLVPNGCLAKPFLEVVGEGKALENPPLPVVAIPTTAGTGSEVTRNAVLCSGEVKVSLRDHRMLPRVAVVDPLLAHSLPQEQTAAGGLDALTQLIEPFLSPASTPFTDALCREALPRIANSLRRAWKTGSDRDARRDMALAATLSGMALANARLGAVHGLAGPLGGLIKAPHGELCARLLPPVMRVNYDATIQNPVVQGRFSEIATLLIGEPNPGALFEWLEDLTGTFAIRGLGAMGLRRQDIPLVATRALQSSSMKGNPARLPAASLENILHTAW